MLISIHAPREGGDVAIPAKYLMTVSFQSTPPVRGATLLINIRAHINQISIHAPREGGDHC